MLNHPLAHSPTMQDSLREWLCTFPDLQETAESISLTELHTLLPQLMHQIDPTYFEPTATTV